MNPLYLLAALFAADILTTLYILRRGGRELNPVMAGVIDVLGAPLGLLAAKVGVFAIVYYYVNPEALWWLCGVYALVVGWNVYQAAK